MAVAVAVAVGGEVANYCDVDTLANLACTQSSIYCTGQSRCTQHYIALHFIALQAFVSHSTGLHCWVGLHTRDCRMDPIHIPPSATTIHHFNQVCILYTTSINFALLPAIPYEPMAMLHTVVGFRVQKSPMQIVYRMCTYSVR